MYTETHNNALLAHTTVDNVSDISSNAGGYIAVICGSMFSGKTEELLRRVKRVQYTHLNLQVFKPHIDKRYLPDKIISHDKRNVQAVCVKSSNEILTKLKSDTHVVAIDEAQFFDKNLPEVCSKLANKGIKVIVAGLDTDYRGIPFGIMPILLAQAEYVTKLHAICVRCKNIAQYTHRTTSEKKQTLIGAENEYEPLCRSCYHNPPTKQSS